MCSAVAAAVLVLIVYAAFRAITSRIPAPLVLAAYESCAVYAYRGAFTLRASSTGTRINQHYSRGSCMCTRGGVQGTDHLYFSLLCGHNDLPPHCAHLLRRLPCLQISSADRFWGLAVVLVRTIDVCLQGPDKGHVARTWGAILCAWVRLRACERVMKHACESERPFSPATPSPLWRRLWRRRLSRRCAGAPRSECTRTLGGAQAGAQAHGNAWGATRL